MRTEKRNGFVLVLIVTALALVGAVMFILNEGAKTMLFQADAAFLEAMQRNLVASGLAWAQYNVSSRGEDLVGETAELDTASFGARTAGLTVHIVAVENDKATIHIETSCSKGRQTVNTSCDYTFQLR